MPPASLDDEKFTKCQGSGMNPYYRISDSPLAALIYCFSCAGTGARHVQMRLRLEAHPSISEFIDRHVKLIDEFMSKGILSEQAQELAVDFGKPAKEKAHG